MASNQDSRRVNVLLRGVDLHGADFRERQLVGLQLDKVILTAADFSGAICRWPDY